MTIEGRAYRESTRAPEDFSAWLDRLEAELPQVISESPDPFERHAARETLVEIQRARTLLFSTTGQVDIIVANELLISGVAIGQLVAQLDASSAFGDYVQARKSSEVALRDKKSRVTPEQRNQVEAAASALASEHSVPTELYRAIATQLGIKLDRVRYIIEGPRRRKR